MAHPFPDTVEHWSIDRLIPYGRNARTHSDGQVAQIAASMVEFGWTNPVLADSQGNVIAGHGRLAAAKSLGLDTVPVVILDHLTEAQRRAYILADNKLALNAGWDEETLAAELHALNGDGYDLGVIGFSDEELDALMAPLDDEGDGQGDETGEDEVPEPPADPVTRPGDLWILGQHRLLCGDSTILADVEKVLGGAPANMCFTDSPYNVDYGAPGKGGKGRRILNDALGGGFKQFLYDVCVNILAVTKGAVYMCMSSSELHTLQSAFLEAGGHWSTFIIWAKNTFTLGRSDYQRQYEPILYGWKEGGGHYWCGARDQGDVWSINKPARNDLHPTMKPVELVERAIGNSSRENEIILDPFGGSGTTLIACERMGRQARLLELDPKYVDVIVLRWQEQTGEAAILDGDGRCFDDIAAGKAVSAG
ncbi:Prophage LambdaMc01, DNA methyltransferase [Magnetospirillum gryphiswaldense MSR-1 v2]|uniref:site-specific DNA-methyltransferase (adenine-specific) n=1 Tax=Magnetospirillum gryphiswaldense (strain DSM 6361 / JCM 21280 / NBRC 15271 / MSR-1) TaxID=431944 RepID=V6F5Q7_MAGGM|nr:site-specific DNA-methyltransferase [Magnetospirillum gryphiswaldense]CDK99818.1 Prophage LambdaMc01, DNA methyltransferase [Magnetospirillum gryphiswaldense MSR-1 v2]